MSHAAAVPVDMPTCARCGRWIVHDGHDWIHALFVSTTHTATPSEQPNGQADG
jgi:hypothetical protein